MTAFEWKTFFVWRVTYICVHVTQAQSKHVSPGMQFLGLGIGGLSHQSCMSLHIGTNNIVGGSIIPLPGIDIADGLAPTKDSTISSLNVKFYVNGLLIHWYYIADEYANKWQVSGLYHRSQN